MRSSLLFFSLLLLCRTSYAETADLCQALRESAARPFARAARLDARGAQAAAGEARSRVLPSATLSERFTWTDEPAGSLFISLNQEDLRLSQDAGAYNFPPARKDFETRVSVHQALYDPDVLFGVKRAEAGARSAEAAARWSEEEAAFAAFQAYLDVQQAAAALNWVTLSRQEAQEVLRLASERRKAGVGLKADELRARVAFSEAQRRSVGAENDLVLARRRLALTMGRTGEVEIAAPLDPGDLAPAREQPLRRADLEALEEQARGAALAHAQSRADWLPRVSTSGSYALHDGEIPFGTEAGAWSVQAGLSWEFFDGLRRRYAGQRTAAEKRAAETRAQEAWREALFAREEAQRRAAEARIQLSAAEAAREEADESFRLFGQRFEAGLSDLSELLAAQEALERVRFDVIQAETRYLLTLGNQHFQQGTFLQALLPSCKEEMP